jgi:hypothetical protein
MPVYVGDHRKGNIAGEQLQHGSAATPKRYVRKLLVNAYRETIQQESDSGNQNDHPLKALPIDRLVDLADTDVTIL